MAALAAHRGWYGDSNAHAAAARLGWQRRRGQRMTPATRTRAQAWEQYAAGTFAGPVRGGGQTARQPAQAPGTYDRMPVMRIAASHATKASTSTKATRPAAAAPAPREDMRGYRRWADEFSKTLGMVQTGRRPQGDLRSMADAHPAYLARWEREHGAINWTPAEVRGRVPERRARVFRDDPDVEAAPRYATFKEPPPKPSLRKRKAK